MVLSLLEIAFSKIPLSTYTGLLQYYNNDSVYHIIYDKVVDGSRDRIKNYLRAKNTRIILKCIYLARTNQIMEMSGLVLGNLSQYKGSLFRLACVHGVINWVESENINQLILEIMDTMEMILPKICPERDVVVCNLIDLAHCRDNNLNIDLIMVIDAYMGFGKYLYPYIVEL